MSLVHRLSVLVAALAVTAGTASACTDVNGTNGKDFVTGDGLVQEIDQADRGKPVDAGGETLDGDQLELADLRGKVVVVNVWGAWCTECRIETPLLVDVADELPGDAAIVGIDVRDGSADDARAYVRTAGIPYPSIYDLGSEQLLRFPAPINPRDIPSTVVLDAEGRVAALIRGAIPSKITLLDVVEKVASEDG